MRYTPGSDCFAKTDSNRFGPSQGMPAQWRIICENGWPRGVENCQTENGCKMEADGHACTLPRHHFDLFFHSSQHLGGKYRDAGHPLLYQIATFRRSPSWHLKGHFR